MEQNGNFFLSLPGQKKNVFIVLYSRAWCSSCVPTRAPLWPLCFVPRTQATPSPAVCLIACRSKHYPSLWKLGNLCRLWMAPDPNLPQPQWVHKQQKCGWHQQHHVNGDALGQAQRRLFLYPLPWFYFHFLALACFTLNMRVHYIALKEVSDSSQCQWGDGCFSPASLLWSLGDFQLWRELVMFPSLNLTLKIVASIKKRSSETWAWVWCS